mgnify:CR=1 FL=1
MVRAQLCWVDTLFRADVFVYYWMCMCIATQLCRRKYLFFQENTHTSYHATSETSPRNWINTSSTVTLFTDTSEATCRFTQKSILWLYPSALIKELVAIHLLISFLYLRWYWGLFAMSARKTTKRTVPLEVFLQTADSSASPNSSRNEVCRFFSEKGKILLFVYSHLVLLNFA